MALHPQAKAFLDGVAAQNGPEWEDLPPEKGRELFASLAELFGQAPEVAKTEDRVVRDDVTARIYWPAGDGPFPVIMYFHGGGWVLGDLDTHDVLCRRLTSEAEAVVVAVDYRRSPETAFPGALEDCYAATTMVVEQSANLNIDSSKITVAGDSAGGNLAAAVAWRAHTHQGPAIAQQVLIYPVLDCRCDSVSYNEFSEGFGLTKAAMQWFWKQYIGTSIVSNDGLASPILIKDLRGLPPTHIVTAEYDVLRDEGEQYAVRLAEAGVPTTHRRYDGMIHGFVHLGAVFDMASEAISDIATVIRAASK